MWIHVRVYVGESLLSAVREWGAARIEFEIESLAATLDEDRESVNQTSVALRVAIQWLTTLLLNQHNYEFVSALLAILLRVCFCRFLSTEFIPHSFA